jgi:hypothetical protein
MSYPVWLTSMSSRCSRMSRRATPWCTSSAVTIPILPRSYSTSPPTAAGQHHLRPPPMALGKASRVERSDRSGAPGTLPLRPVTMVVTRKANNSDEEYVVATKHDFKRQTRPPKDHLEKLLEATYPNHSCPIKHMLKDCTMMKNFMT